MDERLKKLYEALSAEYDMGSFEDFSASLASPEKLERAYSFAKDHFDGIGTIDEFQKSIFPPVKKKSTPKASSGTLPVYFQKPSATKQPARTAASKSDVVSKDGLTMDWGTGEVRQSAFDNNSVLLDSLRESMGEFEAYQEQANPTAQDVALKPSESKNKYSAKEYAMLVPESINKGFYEQAIGGTLKAMGELMLQGVKLIEPNARPEDMWLWQAGNAIQQQFKQGEFLEPTSDPELLDSDLGQIGQGLGQMTAMILTAGVSGEAQAMGKLPAAGSVLKEAGKQFFSRPAIMGAMQMVDEEASAIRQEKQVAESMSREDYVSLNEANGEDPNLAGQKYDELKNRDAEDIIADMLPSVLAAGSTEAIPVAGWFKRLNNVTGGTFAKRFYEKSKDVTVGTFEGAAQEALQEWMTNATAQEVYDFTLESTDGLGQSAKIGGGVQLIFEVLGAAIGSKKRGTIGREKELLEQAEERIEQEQAVLEQNLVNAAAEETSPAEIKQVLDNQVQNGELTQEEADKVYGEAIIRKVAVENTPEEHRTNPEVVDAVAEKTKIDEQIAQKKEEIKTVDAAFTQAARDEIADLEEQSALASLRVADAAGVKPDEKAEQAILLNPALKEKYEASKKKAEERTKSVSSEGAIEGPGKVLEEAPSLTEPFALEPPTGKKAANDYAEQNLDNIARLPEVDTQGLPAEQEAQKIVSEGSPAQLAALWRSEPDTTNPLDGPQGRSFMIRDAVASQKFSDEGLGRGRFSTKELTNVRKRFGGGTLSPSEFAESLSDPESGDFLGIGDITEEDVFEALEANKTSGVPKVKTVVNPVKKAAAKRFKELVGINPTTDYADRLIERSNFFKEWEGVVAEFPEAKVLFGVPPNANLGDRLRGFYDNSLRKMRGVTPGRGLLAKIGESDPQFYSSMTRSGNAQMVSDEIDADGLDVVVRRAMLDNTGEPEGVVAARRVVSLIALGNAMVEANNAGDTAALDAMSDSARELERLLGRKGTEFGQALSMYAIYSQTPDGRLMSSLREVSRKREATRNRMTDGGKPIGTVVDAIVSEVSAEMGITREDANRVLETVFGKKKSYSAARAVIADGKKQVAEARAAIRKAVSGQANIGIPVSQYAKVGSALIDMFSGYAKIYRGNIQKVRASFKRDANDAGLNGSAAYDWLEKNHPEITQPIADFYENMLNSIVGFYNGDIAGDLKGAFVKMGLPDAEAQAVADDFAANRGREIAKKKRSRIKQIVRTHIKSPKKARLIENGLLEAIIIGGLNDDAIRKKIEEKYGIKSFTNEQIADLNQIVMDMKDMHSRGQKLKMMREMMDYMHLHGGIDMASFIASSWYARMLFSLKTLTSVALGNEANFLTNFVAHGLATQGGLYAMGESMKRLVQPFASRFGIMEGAHQGRGLWFGLAEGKRFMTTGEALREMKKVVRSSDIELVSRMSFMDAARDLMTSFANIANAFSDVVDADGFKAKMGAVTAMLSQVSDSAYMLGKTIAIPHSKLFRYSLRALSAADSLRYYSMLDFTLDRKAYQIAVAEGLAGSAAKARAREIIGENTTASNEIFDTAKKEFGEYAAARGLGLSEMFSDVDIAYRAREIAEERLDAAWKSVMDRDAGLQGNFDAAVQQYMADNPTKTKEAAEGAVREVRQRYYDNQMPPTEQARGWAEKAALQNDPVGVMGKVAKMLSADFPAVFDEAINATEPEITGDVRADKKAIGNWLFKKRAGQLLKIYSSFMFPFMKTFANVVNMKMEMMPSAWLTNRVDAMVGSPTLDYRNLEQKRIFIAKQVIGGMILGSLGLWMRMRDDEDDEKKGIVTLKGPRTPEQMNSEKELRNWKQETLVVGDKRIYYGDTPYAGALGILGAVEDNRMYSKDDGEEWSLGSMSMAILGQMFTNASYLRTFSDMNAAMKEEDAERFLAALASPVSGLTSSGLQRDLDRWLSPELRDRRSIENRFVGEMLSRTPFAANQLLDFRYNSLGEEIDPYANESWLTQAIGLDKYISDNEVKNPVFEILADKKVRFGGIGRSIDILGTEATYQEKRDYTLFVGRYRRMKMNKNLDKMRAMTTTQLELQLERTDTEAKIMAELFIILQRKNRKDATAGQFNDVSVAKIDSFIRDNNDMDKVKEKAEDIMAGMYGEEEKIEMDDALFF